MGLSVLLFDPEHRQVGDCVSRGLVAVECGCKELFQPPPNFKGNARGLEICWSAA